MSTFLEATDYNPIIRSFNMEELIDQDSVILDECELTTIQLVKDHISTLYDVDEIFLETGSSRHRTIVNICLKITLYELFSRIAGVMMPDKLKEDYEDAIKLLGKIGAGQVGLAGAPALTNEDGSVKTIFRYGSHKRKSF